MDLSFALRDRGVAVTVLPTELAVLLVGVAARQAASPTARIQAMCASGSPCPLMAPASGAFNAATALMLRACQGE